MTSIAPNDKYAAMTSGTKKTLFEMYNKNAMKPANGNTSAHMNKTDNTPHTVFKIFPPFGKSLFQTVYNIAEIIG
jgi:hypothetical protein